MRSFSLLLCITFALFLNCAAQADQKGFQDHISPLLKKYCFGCHNVDEQTSGIRVDHLDGSFPDRSLKLWEGIRRNIGERSMPPEGEPQPSTAERVFLEQWIQKSLNHARSRKREKNGSIRRLTVDQYRNSLQELLGIRENITEVLPPEAVSKSGFTNNSQSMLLSPLQVEAYFNIAEKALEMAIVDPAAKPVIQNFVMELGQSINPTPCPDKLILGANSHLLANADFVVTEPLPQKPFEFTPFQMETKFRFIEGYQGNSTVRGWREYDSIYHAVFACMRGNKGYPKGRPYQTVPEGLLLRPAIPSAELFGVESTYGPKSNFKVSLRELPHHGNFRVTVRAARYADGLLLDRGASHQSEEGASAIVVNDPSKGQKFETPEAGVYQVDIHFPPDPKPLPSDGSRLTEDLVAHWPLNGNGMSVESEVPLDGTVEGDTVFDKSPFGRGAAFAGGDGSIAVPNHESLRVGSGDFTVAAWIHPRELRQGGIVTLGGYGYTHGWVFDMPNNKGVLRLETARAGNQANGTVQSPRGAIRVNRWQHVAVTVTREDNGTRLYVNGIEVAKGTIGAADIGNPDLPLHIGRVHGANLFKGLIDEVRLYRRSLGPAEIQALVEPGRKFVGRSGREQPHELTVQIDDRDFTSTLQQPAFLVLRLDAGPHEVRARYQGSSKLHRMVLTPLAAEDPTRQAFERFKSRSPRLGVHVGLRRDCGSTFSRVQKPVRVADTKLQEFVFEGAINDYPSPDVEKNNVNYLAGVREIGVRSEYTDGHDVPRLRVRSIQFEGPYYEQWPPKTHTQIFIDSKNKGQPEIYAREIISLFTERAFRRPAVKAEIDSFCSVWQDSFADTEDFAQSIKETLTVILTSPQFLFLIENSATPEAEELAEYELASKLSYFLWNAAPDQTLLMLASAGELKKQLDAQVERMIADDRAEDFCRAFGSEWLNLDKFDVLETDRRRFPKLTRHAREYLRDEPIQLLLFVLRNNRPVSELIRSDYVVVNEIVADYYGLSVPPDTGFQFVPVRHQSENLGGVLTAASIMAGLSDGREANPVKRGAWLARRIIAEPPDDPPPNVPELPEDDSKLTLRQKLEQHRNVDGCRKCHSGIDPWGIPFQQVNAAGLFEAKAVDAASTLPDKTEVGGVSDLKRYLAEDRIDQVAFSVLKHLAEYATGRTLNYNEIEFLRKRGVELKAKGYRTRDLIHFVVNSDVFLTK